MKDIRQSSTYANYLKDIGWKVNHVNGVYFYTKNLPLLGSVLKIQRPEKINFKDIENLSSKNRVFKTILEPKRDSQVPILAKEGYKISSNPYLPTKTLIFNLKPKKQRLKASLTKDARYYLRKAREIKVKNLLVKEIPNFQKSWKRSVGIKRHVPSIKQLKSLKKNFGKNSAFLVAGNNSYNSGAVFLVHDKKAYYWQAFTGKEGRKQFSQYKIVWKGMLWAKSRKAEVFDFEGIYDKRFPNKSWLGFSHFKKGFGGDVKKYPGTFVKNKWKSIMQL